MISLRSYSEVVGELDQLADLGAKVHSVGKSRLGRKIFLITVGGAKRRALVVCRQHGNEPTSTEAMMDYAREMLARESLLEKGQVSIIPMANPDGAELYRHLCRSGKTSLVTSYMSRTVRPYRRDMNRDHKKKKTSEAKAIARAIEEIKPHILLDLHNFYPHYNYTILQRNAYDFCPAVSTNPAIDQEITKKSLQICKIAAEAVKTLGYSVASINQFWPGIYGRLLMPKDDVLETYYPLNHKIPSATFEAVGGFNLCSNELEKGKRLHKAATSAVIKNSVNLKG